jgi:hypothetical protein
MLERGVKRIMVVLSVLIPVCAWFFGATRCGLLACPLPNWGLAALMSLIGTVVFVPLLWVAFFTVRWIIRGFRAQDGT